MSRMTTVISPTLDAAYVDTTQWLITELRRDGHPVDHIAQYAAEHLADVVAAHGVSTEFAASLESERVPDDYDPTDAELEAMWNGPDAHEAHRAAWALHQEMRSL